jgi:hypothetical protein
LYVDNTSLLCPSRILCNSLGCCYNSEVCLLNLMVGDGRLLALYLISPLAT